MGSTKSHTEFCDEPEFTGGPDLSQSTPGELWESSVDVRPKVPLRITDYKIVGGEDEHNTTGSYRSNQVEVVKKQVATMMDDSSEPKEECYKNNSNSKSELDPTFDLQDRFTLTPVPPELTSVPRPSKHGAMTWQGEIDDVTPVSASRSYVKIPGLNAAREDEGRAWMPREEDERAWVSREDDGSTADAIVFGEDTHGSPSQVSQLTNQNPELEERGDFNQYDVDEVGDYLDSNCDYAPCVNMETYLPERKAAADRRQGTFDGFVDSPFGKRDTPKPQVQNTKRRFMQKREISRVKPPRKMASESRVSSRAENPGVNKTVAKPKRKARDACSKKFPSSKVSLETRHTTASSYRFKQSCRRPGVKLVPSARPDTDVIADVGEAPRRSRSRRPMMRLVAGRAGDNNVIGRAEPRDVTNNRTRDVETPALDARPDRGQGSKVAAGSGFMQRARCPGWRRLAAGGRTNDVITHAAAPPPARPRRPMMRMCDVTRRESNVLGREAGDVSNNRPLSDADREARAGGYRRWQRGPRRVTQAESGDVLAARCSPPTQARRSMMRMVRNRVDDQNVLLRAEPANANLNNRADDAGPRDGGRERGEQRAESRHGGRGGRCGGGESSSHRITKACGVRARVATGVADLLTNSSRTPSSAHVTRRGLENTSERIFSVRNEARPTSGVIGQTTVTS